MSTIFPSMSLKSLTFGWIFEAAFSKLLIFSFCLLRSFVNLLICWHSSLNIIFGDFSTYGANCLADSGYTAGLSFFFFLGFFSTIGDAWRFASVHSVLTNSFFSSSSLSETSGDIDIFFDKFGCALFGEFWFEIGFSFMRGISGTWIWGDIGGYGFLSNSCKIAEGDMVIMKSLH